MLNGINKDHLTGALVGVGVCAVGYYAYKKNQEKVDSFLRNQGINLASDNCKEFVSMSLEELMETKETLEDLIAEKEMLLNEVPKEACVE
ncbi:hypothetical protein [Peptacetobacter sp. AB845]|uniref:hypothetical protein n=1 Tax=Peptacetobacter sp. AB845 TaxID=3388429 RepID=UPI0039C8EE67